jgi:uncharacterized protein (TIGR02246 family)
MAEELQSQATINVIIKEGDNIHYLLFSITKKVNDKFHLQNFIIKGRTMIHFKITAAIFLFAFLVSSAFAGDKEDVLALSNKTAEAFNKHDFTTYWSYFTTDNTEFPYVGSALRHDAVMWKDFIEGTANLAYVNYHGQDFQTQIYNGNSAVVTSYYTFTWMEKGGQMNYQSGRATFVAVKQDGKWLIAHMHFSKMF